MKYILFFALLLLFSCSNQNTASTMNSSDFDLSGFEVEAMNGSNLKYVYKMDADKNIIEEGYLKKGLQHGAWVTYNKDGWMEFLNQYDLGLLNGPQLTFNKRGQIAERKTYWNGELSGLFVQYKNGYTLKEIMYKDGKVNGFIKEYNRSGKILKWAEYKNNELHGKVESYNEEGKLLLKYIYENGKKISGGIVE